mgnify:CR=1 FL=1
MSDDHQSQNVKSRKEQSPLDEKEVTGTERQATRTENKNPTNWFRQLPKTERFEFGIAIIGLVIAALLLVSTSGQWYTANKSLKTAERAWVTVKRISLDKPIKAGEIPTVNIEFYNSGHSPALKLAIIHTVGLRDRLPFGEMPLMAPQGYRSLTVIGPSVSHFSNVGLPRQLTQSDMKKVDAQQAFLVTWGEMAYMDIFDKPHRTTFCYRSVSTTTHDFSGWLHGAAFFRIATKMTVS